MVLVGAFLLRSSCCLGQPPCISLEIHLSLHLSSFACTSEMLLSLCYPCFALTLSLSLGSGFQGAAWLTGATPNDAAFGRDAQPDASGAQLDSTTPSYSPAGPSCHPCIYTVLITGVSQHVVALHHSPLPLEVCRPHTGEHFLVCLPWHGSEECSKLQGLCYQPLGEHKMTTTGDLQS